MLRLKGILFLVLCSFVLNVYADHVSGANITYQCTENANEYEVTLTLYRDCSGIGVADSVPINIDNNCGFPYAPLMLYLVDFEEVSQICPAEQDNSTCNDGVLPGMEEYTFRNTIILPDTCDSWIFSYLVCARNPLVNLDGSSCLYVESTLNSATQACNNTLTVNSQPIPYICNNLPVTYDLGVQEPDGDSLVFTLVDALTTGAVSTVYMAGYTGNNPIPGITLNPSTGEIAFTPTTIGNFVVVIQIEEYNENGLLLGTVLHEFQFVVQNCLNSPPVAPSTITNFTNFGTNSVFFNTNEIIACTNDQFCFDVTFSDPDTLDSIVLSSNILEILPEATFIQTGSNPAIATICWDYQGGYTGSLISIYASDQACPILGFSTFVVDLHLPPAFYPGEDSTISFCNSIGEINLFDYLGGYHESGGIWFDPNFDTINPIVLTDTIISGIYNYVLYSAPGQTSCVSSDSAQLIIGNGSVFANWHEDSLQNLSCYGIQDGAAYVDSIHGENGPFNVIWTGSQGVFDSETVIEGGVSNQDSLYLGLWNISISDTIGCIWTHDFDLSEPGEVSINFLPNPPQCYGMTNGSITVFSASAPTDENQFIIYDNLNNILNYQGSNTANNLSAGWYTTSLLDANGCLIFDSIQLIDPLPLNLELVLTHPLCFNDSSGLAHVDTVINSQGNYNQIEYSWSPNPLGNNGINQPSNIGLSVGEYMLKITDELGCTYSTNYFIHNPNPLVGIIDIVSPTYCRSSSLQNGNGEVTITTAGLDSSGTGTVTYLWENIENGELSTNTTFVVSEPGWMRVTIKDDNNCIFIDSVFVDSLNPTARFELISDGFVGPGEYEGLENLKVKFINGSFNLNKDDPLFDPTFSWNLYTNEINSGYENWFLSHDIDEPIQRTYSGEQEYLVCLVAKNFNYCLDTVCELITVHAIPELDIPNVFTPGKAPNSTFYFPAQGFTTFNATVYNKFGIEVFRFSSLEDQWDGNNYINNKPCVDGVYYYSYQAETNTGNLLEGQGNIYLVRPK